MRHLLPLMILCAIAALSFNRKGKGPSAWAYMATLFLIAAAFRVIPWPF